jgi:hypothetical protein
MITFCFGPIVQFGPELAQKWSPSQTHKHTTRTRHNVRTTDMCSGRGGHARIAPPPPCRVVTMLNRRLSLRLRVASSSGEAECSLSSLARPLSRSVPMASRRADAVAMAGLAKLPASLLPAPRTLLHPRKRSAEPPSPTHTGVVAAAPTHHPCRQSQAAPLRVAFPATAAHG